MFEILHQICIHMDNTHDEWCVFHVRDECVHAEFHTKTHIGKRRVTNRLIFGQCRSSCFHA